MEILLLTTITVKQLDNTWVKHTETGKKPGTLIQKYNWLHPILTYHPEILVPK